MQEEQQRARRRPACVDVDRAPAELAVGARAGARPRPARSGSRVTRRRLRRRAPATSSRASSEVGAALQLVGVGRAARRGAPGTRGRTCAGSARPLGAEMLLGAVDHPEQLGDDLLAARRLASRRPVSSSKIQGLPSEPRAIITAAAPDSRVGAARGVGAVEAAGDDHRHLDPLGQLAGRARSRARPCGRRSPAAGGSRSRRRRPPRPAAPRGRSRSDRRRSMPERSLTVTGSAAALDRAAGERQRQLGVAQQLRRRRRSCRPCAPGSPC